MAEKLSWTELRRALASRADVSEKEANAFLNALSEQLIEALKSDKQVKINGLGTFKLQAVAPRKSVDVTTGEEITIEGYNKIVFGPEAGIKELVESIQPAAVSSQPSEIDPIQKLGVQAEEIVDILGDLGQSPEKPEEPAVEEPQPEEPVVEEPVVEEPKEEEPVYVAPEPTYVAPEPEPVYVAPAPEPQPKKKSHFVRDVLICVIILLLLLFGAYFFFRGQISGWIDNLLNPAPAEPVEIVVPVDTMAVEVVEVETEPVETMQPAEEVQQPAEQPEEQPKKTSKKSQKKKSKSNKISQDQILAEFLAVSGELDDISPAAGQELTYAGWKTVEPIHEGSRLAWMAKVHYGSKIYWPYLFDANRDKFTDPNDIETGTPIRVPELTAAQLDTTNVQTMETLNRLKAQAESLMK
ncbi:MAG: HU family DNA-binding protein [Paludibacteraceae bacterium]|nr:HU family DNA-binding protein [Paludibacteraceae bacterium]